MDKKIIKTGILVIGLLSLSACHDKKIMTVEPRVTAAIVTDVAGIDDKSFNQGAWEGLTEWGKQNGLKQGAHGYNYFESDSESDYVRNFNMAVQTEYDLIFGIGYKLEKSIKEVAELNPVHHFVAIDSVIDLPNVTSVTFRDNEAAFLAGVAAAETTKTNQVGFIGGIRGVIVDHFEAGFLAGVKAVNPEIVVDIKYIDSFTDFAKGKAIASVMYESGVDVIFQVAGAGAGIFAEAKEIVEADPSREVWVIGVDQDQSPEGYISEERNITLTSTIKGVGTAVKDLASQAMNGQYHDGEHLIMGLQEQGVGLTKGELSESAQNSVEKYKNLIISGEQYVPLTTSDN
ncbi:nucleoside-binding protein [Granulicatella balaenopterae]|uniref:Nucleoside-binding protein n=1 Tax=Granulicatella balaenopterae TaxID=137733 RepID=A0A1H9MNE4_9LACT|nr:BMP family ABC transporter substrate-binding protein [Granulicatella balaenopterae]SER25212.1 nucleoside-binding protein [Granulicatella balaenopterae]